MTDPLICPDCEGVLAGEPGEGQWRCRCDLASQLAPGPRKTASAEDRANESLSGESQAGVANAGSTATVEKICRVCKKNLAGHRRLKDDRGYICLACNEAEENAPDDGLTPCAECGRRLRPAGLTEFNGMQICKKCLNDHKELNKFKPMPVNLSANFAAEDKAKLRNMLLLAGVLLLIIILASVGVIGSRR